MKKNILLFVAIGLLVIAALIFQCSCNMGVPVDWTEWGIDPEPIDTNDIIIEPLIIDTCEEYLHLQDTNFVTLSAYFWIDLVNPQYYYYNNSGLTFFDPVSLLEYYWPQYSFTAYQSQSGIAIIADGATSTAIFSGKIIVIDGAAVRTTLTGYKNAFFFWSALTYEEALAEASHRVNVESFDNYGTDWTQDQNDTYNREVLKFDLCKHGERRADFRNTEITQSIVDSASLYQWNIVLQ